MGWGVPNISTNNLLYALFASDAMMWAVCGFGRWAAMACIACPTNGPAKKTLLGMHFPDRIYYIPNCTLEAKCLAAPKCVSYQY